MVVVLASHDLQRFTFLPGLLARNPLPGEYGFAWSISSPPGATIDDAEILNLLDGTRLTAQEAYAAAVRQTDGLSLIDSKLGGNESNSMRWGEWPAALPQETSTMFHSRELT